MVTPASRAHARGGEARLAPRLPARLARLEGSCNPPMSGAQPSLLRAFDEPELCLLPPLSQWPVGRSRRHSMLAPCRASCACVVSRRAAAIPGGECTHPQFVHGRGHAPAFGRFAHVSPSPLVARQSEFCGSRPSLSLVRCAVCVPSSYTVSSKESVGSTVCV